MSGWSPNLALQPMELQGVQRPRKHKDPIVWFEGPGQRASRNRGLCLHSILYHTILYQTTICCTITLCGLLSLQVAPAPRLVFFPDGDFARHLCGGQCFPAHENLRGSS